MDIEQAKLKIKQLENDLDYYLKEKELIFNKTQPQSADITKELVEGGKRVNKLDEYLISDEEKSLTNNINIIQDKINNLNIWIIGELKILGELDPIKQKVVKYRNAGRTWVEVEDLVGLSMSTCRRIHKNYTLKRNI